MPVPPTQSLLANEYLLSPLGHALQPAEPRVKWPSLIAKPVVGCCWPHGSVSPNSPFSLTRILRPSWSDKVPSECKVKRTSFPSSPPTENTCGWESTLLMEEYWNLVPDATEIMPNLVSPWAGAGASVFFGSGSLVAVLGVSVLEAWVLGASVLGAPTSSASFLPLTLNAIPTPFSQPLLADKVYLSPSGQALKTSFPL